MPSGLQRWTMIAIVLSNAYSFGAGCVERFVNYRSWPLLEKADFAAYHRAQQPWILAAIVMPLNVSLLLQVVLCVFKPPTLSWITAMGLLVPSVIGALSTVVFQLPIHDELSASGYSLPAIERLLRTDWIRRAADVLRMVATVALLGYLVRQP